jgi:hypothetical protein
MREIITALTNPLKLIIFLTLPIHLLDIGVPSQITWIEEMLVVAFSVYRFGFLEFKHIIRDNDVQ